MEEIEDDDEGLIANVGSVAEEPECKKLSHRHAVAPGSQQKKICFYARRALTDRAHYRGEQLDS